MARRRDDGHVTNGSGRDKAGWPHGFRLILALIAGSAAYLLTQPPTLTLSSYVVSPGQRITVTADHLPPYQLAEVWILSNPYIYSFRADAIGRATRQVVIPVDIDGGDHTLRICWGGSCPLTTNLQVDTTAALESPAVLLQAHPPSEAQDRRRFAISAWVLA